MPQETPAKRPFSPPSRTLIGLEHSLGQILDPEAPDTQKKVALDKTYGALVLKMEGPLRRATNAPLRHLGNRYGTPKVAWLSANAVESQQRAQWKS
eukprot:3489568-Pyramimonas_sp.AAC.1